VNTWNEAALSAVSRIFNHRIIGIKVLVSVRDFLDEFIQRVHSGVDATSEDWEKFGAISLAAAQHAQVIPRHGKENFRSYEAAMAGTLIRKQKDYGPDAIMRFGSNGILVRTHDKVARLENLKKKGLEPNNESVQDGYMDLLGYAALGIILEEGQFGLPMV